jgi:hypothetical protein
VNLLAGFPTCPLGNGWDEAWVTPKKPTSYRKQSAVDEHYHSANRFNVLRGDFDSEERNKVVPLVSHYRGSLALSPKPYRGSRRMPLRSSLP